MQLFLYMHLYISAYFIISACVRARVCGTFYINAHFIIWMLI